MMVVVELVKHGREAFTCPFCGAPYRGVVPSDVVQVGCQYCGGMILVPPELGGSVHRCPNHPEALAIGLCNDCGKSYCSHCLHIYTVEHARLYVCPNCLRARLNKQVQSLFLIGLILFLSGLFLLPVSLVWSILWIAFLSIPVIAYGLYRMTHPAGKPTVFDEIEAPTIYEEKEALKKGTNLDARKLYKKMLLEYSIRWGSISGKMMLNSRINAYLKRGFDREEAIRRVAWAEGHI